jgi:hypothetical protein
MWKLKEDMKKRGYIMGGGNRESNGAFMSTTNCQGIENWC